MATTYNTVTVTSTATQILASEPGRKFFVLFNNGNNTMFIGPDSSITTSTGMSIDPHAYFQMNGERMWKGAVYGITASSTNDVRYWSSTE